MSLALQCDRFDYIEGAHLFWSEHHGGQFSDGYQRLSRYISTFKYSPGPCHSWASLSEMSRIVYRAWCNREGVRCDYDSVRYALEDAGYDVDNPSGPLDYFLDKYGCDNIANDVKDSGLCNYGHMDFVNNDMCYTRDLLAFYDENEEEILDLVDDYCDACGYTSKLHAFEGQDIETPDDFKMALVNCGMTYLGLTLLNVLEERRGN